MADRLTKEQRHKNMSAIRGKNTKPELLVRKFLFSRGFRYRLNHPRLSGHPDLVLRKYRAVIFVNGCFNWHSHTVMQCHPMDASSFCSFRSRSLFFWILFFQNSEFVFGSTKYLHPSCPCQKQPSTNTAIFFFGNTKSGCPFTG